MNESLTMEQAKSVMGDSFIGPCELKGLDWIGIDGIKKIPDIPFSKKKLQEKAKDYLMILGVESLSDGSKLTIRNLLTLFGKDPTKKEPCFYNQDWYDKETFIDIPLQTGWFLIRKNVYEESRAVQPQDLMQIYEFPSAIKCAYTFFVVCEVLGKRLWEHDFVWCSDVDHNGDRIYVGKYNDMDGINKNGFNIHRHLALRECYGCID